MPLQVEVLEQSFERVKPHATEFSSSFYNNLLADFPQLRHLFAKTDMEQQQQKLVMSLVLVIENLRNPNYLKLILKNLGERHVGYGAVQEHYPMVGVALLKTFESYLGTDWTPEVKQAWVDAYGVLVEMMLEGAKYPEKVPELANVVQPSAKSVVEGQASYPSPAKEYIPNNSHLSHLENGSKLNPYPVVVDKAPIPPPASASNINNGKEIPQLQNVSNPGDKSVIVNQAPAQASATDSKNLKLLLIISIVAGLLGFGFLYYHSNSKQDNGSLTSSIAKTT